jgi:hypothetical protein
MGARRDMDQQKALCKAFGGSATMARLQQVPYALKLS